MLFIGCLTQHTVSAQPRITDTPVPVQLPTQAAQPTEITLLTPTATTTATLEPAIRLVASAASADINVRNLPDVTGNRLGSLEQEREYIVTGRFFSWYQFEYNSSDSGLAWVFGDLVEIIGDPNQIPIIDPFAVPTAVPSEDAEAATATALVLIPGAPETATAQTRLVELPTLEAEAASAGDTFPPTFTPPPDIGFRSNIGASNPPTPTAIPSAVERATATLISGNVPPIIPIIGLFGFGVLGLFVALLRR